MKAPPTNHIANANGNGEGKDKAKDKAKDKGSLPYLANPNTGVWRSW